MKTLAKIVGIGVLGGLWLVGPLSTPANVSVSATVQVRAKADFDVPLAAHGSWAEIRTYGRCWRPTSVPVGWRPYCEGRWVWTDCGWYWESDEPWAWACYHYGRWVYDSEIGWFWVPDVEWAPAWVYWRVGGGFIGWVPCPPRGVVIAPPLFGFVAVGRFHERVRLTSVVVNDTKIINQTKEITEVKRANRTIDGARQKVVINEGPGVAVVQKATGRKIQEVPVQQVVERAPMPHNEAQEIPKPNEKATKPPTPEPVQPPSGTPESPLKPNPSEVAPPAKNDQVRPVEPSPKQEPSVKPARPREGKGHKPDFDSGKDRGRGKGKL
ncbi:MAG: hypothetical protein QM813_17840 [Verrucomicrobiota bacterium]